MDESNVTLLTFFSIGFSKSDLVIILTSHEVPSFLHASMTFWYLPSGTIFTALNAAHPDSTIKRSTECAFSVSTVQRKVCSNAEWYNVFSILSNI
jgi:hypothetical protein